MKISKLIQKLSQIQVEMGDLNVLSESSTLNNITFCHLDENGVYVDNKHMLDKEYSVILNPHYYTNINTMEGTNKIIKK